MLAEWLELMANEPVRMTLEAGVGAVFAFVVWLVGSTPMFRAIPSAGRKFFPVIGAGFGVPIAFMVSVFVPGVEALEMIGALALGGGASHFVQAGAKRVGADAKVQDALSGSWRPGRGPNDPST